MDHKKKSRQSEEHKQTQQETEQQPKQRQGRTKGGNEPHGPRRRENNQ